jgi:hypothetical protein
MTNVAPALVRPPKPPMPNANAIAESVPPSAELLAGNFLRALHALVSATRLYQRNHPRITASLESAEQNLRTALGRTGSVDVRVEPSGLALLPNQLGQAGGLLADQRGELRSLAAQLRDAGVASLTFLPGTNFSELELLARAVYATSRLAAQQRGSGGAGQRNWNAWLAEHRISGVRVNSQVERREEHTVLAVLIGALESAQPSNASVHFPECGFEELREALEFLSSAASRFEQAQRQPALEAAQIVRSEISSAKQQTIELIKFGLANDPPQPGDSAGTYFPRLCRTLVVNFLSAEYRTGRIRPLDVRPLLMRLSQFGPQRDEEAEGEIRAERFWSSLPAREKARVLASGDAWCMPVPVLRMYVEPLIAAERKGAQASGREARRALADFAGCVRSEEGKARRATAAGTVELADLMDRLWPHPRFGEVAGRFVDALLAEVSPGIAGLLAAATEMLSRLALEHGDYTQFEHILNGLEHAPRDQEHEAITALSRRIVSHDRWLLLIDTALANRPLDPGLPKLLRREPERLLDRLGLLLTSPEGTNSFPAMARLVRAAGEPVLTALETHLSQPRHQRVATAIKLLSAVNAERLAAALPRSFPGWDWALQDLAVTELARQPGAAMRAQIARTFLEMLTEAHFYVMPSMLDHIALAGDTSAAPRLIEIAEGKVDAMRDLFVRIKAIETIGRLRAEQAAPMLRALMRGRSGLTHEEPAGLRSAAEEALALIENRPGSARLRASKEAAAQLSANFERPRRYMRFRLSPPLPAKIAGLHEAEAVVHSIALGGAMIETAQPLTCGETVRLEMRAGIRRISVTSMIRSARAQGYGIEFIHMKQADRERLRRFVAGLR